MKNWHSKRTSTEPGLGATYARWYHFPLSKPMEAVVTITAYERPTRFAFESRTKPGLARIEFRLEPVSGGVRVTKHEQMEHGGLLGVLFSLSGPVMRREARKLMENLKRVLESKA